MISHKRISWILFSVFAVLSLAIWLKFSYPTLSFTNFSVDRNKALAIAKDYLASKDIETSSFTTATVFTSEKRANHYLQNAIGFKGLKAFVQQHDFDIFFWIVRFFNEQKKEEYRIAISSSSGQIIALKHTIDDNVTQPPIEKHEAQENAINFLRKNFGFVPDQYVPQSDLTNTFDNRTEFYFSWQKKNVYIPWSKKENTGAAKLITTIRVSGDEILAFSKNTFLVPDEFNRYIAQQTETGVNLSVIIKTLYYVLFAMTIFFIIIRQNHLAMHVTKKFYIGVMLITFILSLLTNFNHFQDILFNYKTTSSFKSYFWRLAIGTITNSLFATIAILMPSLSGELLHYETLKDQKEGSILYYIQSTFFSRHMAKMIFLGYFVAIFMLGLQSLIIEFGQRYLGVWVEHTWIENLSAAYVPALATFTWGFKTSLSEEIMYRLFAIALGKKLFDKLFPKGGAMNIFGAALCSSLIWGFAHSGYPVFPMWFRGLEMTLLGLFLSFMYLNYGIIPVIIGHYLFNVFWHSAEHLLGISPPLYYYSSLGVLLLPFAFALITFFLNKREELRPLQWSLNKHQLYNLDILKSFLNTNKDTFHNTSNDQIKKEITSHGWDPAVVEIAIEDFQKNH